MGRSGGSAGPPVLHPKVHIGVTSDALRFVTNFKARKEQVSKQPELEFHVTPFPSSG